MKSLFDAHVAMTQQQNFEALQMYSELRDHCFQTSFYILSQLALAQYNLKGRENIQASGRYSGGGGE